jgi:hypothetical protein
MRASNITVLATFCPTFYLPQLDHFSTQILSVDTTHHLSEEISRTLWSKVTESNAAVLTVMNGRIMFFRASIVTRGPTRCHALSGLCHFAHPCLEIPIACGFDMVRSTRHFTALSSFDTTRKRQLSGFLDSYVSVILRLGS